MQTRKISEYGWLYCFKENSVIAGGTLGWLNEGIKRGDIKKATPDNVYTEERINGFVAKVKAKYPDCQIII